METNISHIPKKKTERGIALLMTLIVVGTILSVGISLLDLSTRQVRLATNTRDSEIAFHAANAGVECALYWRRNAAASMESGIDIDPSCFNVSWATYSLNDSGEPLPQVSGPGEANIYRYSFTWGTNNDHCTIINTLISSSSPLEVSDTTVTNIQSVIPSYPDATSRACGPGGRCSVISVRGYNKPCSVAINPTSNFGIVEREVLLQF